MHPRFHLAFPIQDIAETEAFYVNILGATTGRQAERWIDFDFWGHQLSAHVVDEADRAEPSNPVDGQDVPVRHFGVILEWQAWHALRDRLVAARTRFIIEPQIRFAGKTGEQATMFFLDPSGNALEFKAFADEAAVFERG
ncbi:MAG: VOC family protein [Myxococcota bacterium]